MFLIDLFRYWVSFQMILWCFNIAHSSSYSVAPGLDSYTSGLVSYTAGLVSYYQGLSSSVASSSESELLSSSFLAFFLNFDYSAYYCCMISVCLLWTLMAASFCPLVTGAFCRFLANWRRANRASFVSLATTIPWLGREAANFTWVRLSWIVNPGRLEAAFFYLSAGAG